MQRTRNMFSIAVALAVGCVEESDVFVCTTDAMCVRNSVQGTCEASQRCSFIDTNCASGRRYTEHAGGELASACVEKPCPDNLVVNPSFDNGSSGWRGVNATISLVPGRTGNALQACFTDGSYFNITDEPSTVQNPPQGAAYRMSLWARTDTPNPDSYATLREIGPTDYVDAANTYFASTTSWQEVVVNYGVTRADSIGLEGYAGVASPLPGDCLQIDDICLATVP